MKLHQFIRRVFLILSRKILAIFADLAAPHLRELNAMDQVIGIMLATVVIGLLADKILFSP